MSDSYFKKLHGTFISKQFLPSLIVYSEIEKEFSSEDSDATFTQESPSENRSLLDHVRVEIGIDCGSKALFAKIS